MQAQTLLQDLLDTACPFTDAKRRPCLAKIVAAGSKGSLSMMGISRMLRSTTPIRHRIIRCDRLFSVSIEYRLPLAQAGCLPSPQHLKIFPKKENPPEQTS